MCLLWAFLSYFFEIADEIVWQFLPPRRSINYAIGERGERKKKERERVAGKKREEIWGGKGEKEKKEAFT